MPKQQIEIDVPEGYEVERVGTLSCYDDKKYKCVYFKPKQPEFIEVREYLVKTVCNRFILESVTKNLTRSPEQAELSPGFLKWLDHDWRKVEI